jgi:hypothetical protein
LSAGVQFYLSPDTGLRAQIIATLRQPPYRHFARRDQHRPEADHLGKPVQYPVEIAPVFDASGQAFGNPEPPLDCQQQQYSGIRGHLAAVEIDMQACPPPLAYPAKSP